MSSIALSTKESDPCLGTALTPSPTIPIGRIHSVETGGAVDGPGLRYVVFMQGCPLRCLYCHNPDSQALKDGREAQVDEIVSDILRYASYLKHGGGVTVSGGEPLVQAAFVRELLRQCKAHGLHTALDTSGFAPLCVAKKVLDYVDLVLLDLKAFDEALYHRLTGVKLQPTLDLLAYLEEVGIDVWIRHVLVPGLTDDFPTLEKMADYLLRFHHIRRVEILPFHKMGEYKWHTLGRNDYQLADTPEPSHALVEQAREVFRKRGFVVA